MQGEFLFELVFLLLFFGFVLRIRSIWIALSSFGAQNERPEAA